jgi:hypothetical protein
VDIIQFNSKQTFKPIEAQLRSASASFQAWVYRTYSPTFSVDQVLFRHLGFLDLIFTPADPTFLTFANIGRGSTGETSGKLFFPYKRWVFIEVTNTQSLFTINLYYNNGTLI